MSDPLSDETLRQLREGHERYAEAFADVPPGQTPPHGPHDCYRRFTEFVRLCNCHLPALLDEVERLRRERDRLRADLRHLTEDAGDESCADYAERFHAIAEAREIMGVELRQLRAENDQLRAERVT